MKSKTLPWLIAAALLGVAVAGCCSSINTGDGEDGKAAAPAAPAAPTAPAAPAAPATPAAQGLAAAMKAFGPKPQPAAPAGQPANPDQATQQMAQAMAAAMQGMGQAAAAAGGGKPVKVVGFEKLITALPDAPGGWTAQDPKGNTSGFGGLQGSKASRRYTKGDQSVTVEIMDSSFNAMALQVFQMAQMVQERSTEGYKVGGNINGYPVIEEWKKSNQRAKLGGMVANRFIVQVEGRPFADTAVIKSFFTSAKFDLLGGFIEK